MTFVSPSGLAVLPKGLPAEEPGLVVEPAEFVGGTSFCCMLERRGLVSTAVPLEALPVAGCCNDAGGAPRNDAGGAPRFELPGAVPKPAGGVTGV